MRIAICLSLLLLMVSSLRAEEAITPEDPKLGRPVDFYKDVFPILQSKCLACHSAAVKESDLILESPEMIHKGGSFGDTVIPGKPEESYLYLLSARTDEPVMPPLPNKVQAKALTPRELGIFKQWILEGAKGGDRQLDTSIAWQPVPESYKAVYSLAFDPAQRFLYTGRGNRIFVYDTVTGQEVSRLGDPALQALRQGDQPVYGPGVAQRDFVHSLAISPDGKTLASGGFRVIKLWEKQSPTQLSDLKLPVAFKASVVDSTGNWTAFLLENNSIQLWNMANGQPGVLIPADDQVLNAITFSPDGSSIIAGAESGAIRISTIADGTTKLGLTTASPIQAIAGISDVNQVATAHADNVIRVWNFADTQNPVAEGAEPPKPALELSGHSQPVTAIAVHSERKELVTGSRDSTLRVWNLADGKQLFSQNIGSPVLAVAISADGQIVAGSGENKVTQIWGRDNKKVADVQGNQQLAGNVARLTDDQTVAKAQFALADTALKNAEKDKTQREESLKKAQEQKEKVTKELAEAEKKAADAKAKLDEATAKLTEKPEDAALKKAKEDAEKAFQKEDEAQKKAMDAVKSADRAIELSNQSIATAAKNVEQRTQEKTAADAKQKEADATLATAKEAATAGTQAVASLHISNGGKVLITSGTAQPIQFWNLSNGTPAGMIDIPSDNVTKTLFTATGSLLTLTPDHAKAWDISDRWSLVATLGVDPATPLDTSKSQIEDRVTALAFSPDGKLLASGGGEPSRNGELLLWDVPGKKLARKIEEAHSDTISDVEFSRDGALLASGAADKFVKVFKVQEGTLLRSYEGHTDHVLGVGFKADQSHLVSCGADNAIKIWNAETGEQARTISNYSKQVTSVDYVGVSDNIISCGGDKTVKYHTASNGRNYRGFAGNNDFVYSAISTGDEGLVIAAGEDGTVRVWNGKDGKLLMSFEAPQGATETAQK